MKRAITFVFVLLFLISLGANVFFIFLLRQQAHYNISETIEDNYPLLTEDISHNQYEDDTIDNFLPLRDDIELLTMPYRSDIAVYFEYLPTGTSIGINEDAEFTAASLLKVPVVMSYFRMKERLGEKDDKEVTLQKKELNSEFGDLYKRGAGAKISLGEAVEKTLINSDNTASLVIADYVPTEDFTYVYEGLDIEPMTDNNAPVITAQQYTAILKSLYFSSILNRDNSQHILDLLTKTKFNDMIPAGVPDSVHVAHKIGLIDNQIYNDCGIVYIPKRAYALCIISQSDLPTAKERGKAISKKIYDYVSNYVIE